MLDTLINKIISWILKVLGINNTKKQEQNYIIKNEYKKRNLMTQTELFFYNKIKELENEYKIIPQLNIGTIVEKQNKGYRNELFKNIDFAIFSNDFKEILLLIELNDYTHEQKKRKQRDKKIKEICNNANIKLITFYTKYPNEKEYVLNRIKEEIKKEER